MLSQNNKFFGQKKEKDFILIFYCNRKKNYLGSQSSDIFLRIHSKKFFLLLLAYTNSAK
jgi:hypothetical protein